LCYNRDVRLTQLSPHNCRNYVRLDVDLSRDARLLLGDRAWRALGSGTEGLVHV